ncbi:hypothetical protein KH5_02030 [Urechidicola sp. KH5]
MNLEKHIRYNASEFDDLTVSKESDTLFKNKLKSRLHTPKKGKVINWRVVSIAASILLIVGTLFFLNEGSLSNNKEMQQLMASLSDKSTGARLEAVYKIDDAFLKEDAQIIDVLIGTLLKDTNANVKIATIEALLKFPNNEQIRNGLVQALKVEEQPLVQIKLINSLSALRETRAKEPLREIINNQESFDIVKSNAHLAMANLNK